MLKTNTVTVRLAWGMALGVLAIAMGGCWGVHTPPEVDPSTAESRVEQEVVPSAELVRQSMRPKPRDRYAFRRGADRLLVLTKVISYARRVQPGSGASTYAPTQRYDAVFERAWITIPLGTQPGQLVRLQDLESDFLLGYDVKGQDYQGNLEDGYYIYPARIDGTVIVREERADALVLDLNVLVSPERLEPWQVSGTFTVPVAADGIHAHAAPADAEVWASKRRGSTTTYPMATPAPEAPAAPSAPPAPAAEAPAPATDAAAAPPAVEAPAAPPATTGQQSAAPAGTQPAW